MMLLMVVAVVASGGGDGGNFPLVALWSARAVDFLILHMLRIILVAFIIFFII